MLVDGLRKKHETGFNGYMVRSSYRFRKQNVEKDKAVKFQRNGQMKLRTRAGNEIRD